MTSGNGFVTDAAGSGVTLDQGTRRETERLRPPTQLGQRADAGQVEVGHRLARLALGLASEQVRGPEAVDALADGAQGDVMTLRLAEDLLAFTRMEASSRVQVEALFTVQDAQEKLARGERRSWLSRLGGR